MLCSTTNLNNHRTEVSKTIECHKCLLPMSLGPLMQNYTTSRLCPWFLWTMARQIPSSLSQSLIRLIGHGKLNRRVGLSRCSGWVKAASWCFNGALTPWRFFYFWFCTVSYSIIEQYHCCRAVSMCSLHSYVLESCCTLLDMLWSCVSVLELCLWSRTTAVFLCLCFRAICVLNLCLCSRTTAVFWSCACVLEP